MFPLTVNHLSSPLPRWAVQTAFALMLLSAALSPTPITQWMNDHCAWVKALVNTLGDLVMCYGICQGMRLLYKPLTGWWGALIVLLIAGGVTTLLLCVETWREHILLAGVGVAALTPIVYIPPGVLLLSYYRGAMAKLGIWMILHCIVSNLLPVLWVLAGWDEWYFILDTLFIIALLGYAWSLRRLLLPPINTAQR